MKCPNCGDQLYLLWQEETIFGFGCNNCKKNYRGELEEIKQ